MQVYNTLGRTLEAFVPRDPGKVSMYVCGPTVQSEPHLGHGRAGVAFDVMRRYFRWRGFEVTYVQNVTDIEDKIIAAANERGVPVEELAAEMTARFNACYRSLGIERPDVEPRATEHIEQMISLIGTLIDRDLAYPAGGDVYFAVRNLPGYGKLSGRNLDDLQAGARVTIGEDKRDPLDFALWKGAKPGEPEWDSPWGSGRPGWHIECSAMAAEYLGEGFDIHGGGTDLIFPHHENEIAQSEGAGAASFARYWLHNEMLNLQGEKMAKSTGHIIDLATALDRFGGVTVRLFYLRAHYRTPLEYSEQLLEDADSALERLRTFCRRAPVGKAAPDPDFLRRFTAAMDDDFNTPDALAVVFESVKEGNRRLDEGLDADPIVSAFSTMVGVLGLELAEDDGDDLSSRLGDIAGRFGISQGTVDDIIESLLELRAKARDERDWATSDGIRDELAGIGVIVEDAVDGARWHRG
ncbi:MAG: cysteine--tRNA ligase [Acidimicrobiia bacterium]|nr:cysteine--tRNA ligase [Acidimicrobiia bacterium]